MVLDRISNSQDLPCHETVIPIVALAEDNDFRLQSYNSKVLQPHAPNIPDTELYKFNHKRNTITQLMRHFFNK